MDPYSGITGLAIKMIFWLKTTLVKEPPAKRTAGLGKPSVPLVPPPR